MNPISVSFGKRIPISTCKIYDKQNHSYVNATFYELDCKDVSDILDIEDAKGNWKFKEYISKDMKEVLFPSLSKLFNFFEPIQRFYVLKTDNNDETVGMMETRESNKISGINIHEIESDPEKKYKYIGKNMIALLCKESLSDKKSPVYVEIPLSGAMDFYSKCGFMKNSEGMLYLSKRKMKGLSQSV